MPTETKVRIYADDIQQHWMEDNSDEDDEDDEMGALIYRSSRTAQLREEAKNEKCSSLQQTAVQDGAPPRKQQLDADANKIVRPYLESESEDPRTVNVDVKSNVLTTENYVSPGAVISPPAPYQKNKADWVCYEGAPTGLSEFTVLTGVAAAPLDIQNIDTDMIIPKDVDANNKIVRPPTPIISTDSEIQFWQQKMTVRPPTPTISTNVPAMEGVPNDEKKLPDSQQAKQQVLQAEPTRRNAEICGIL